MKIQVYNNFYVKKTPLAPFILHISGFSEDSEEKAKQETIISDICKSFMKIYGFISYPNLKYYLDLKELKYEAVKS